MTEHMLSNNIILKCFCCKLHAVMHPQESVNNNNNRRNKTKIT